MHSSFDHFKGLSGMEGLIVDAKKAEAAKPIGAEMAVTQCRKALEHAVKWMYDIDEDLTLPADRTLLGMMNAENFKEICPEPILERMHIIRKMGNRSIHETSTISEEIADICIEALFYVFDFVAFSYYHDYIQARYFAPSDEENIVISQPFEASSPAKTEKDYPDNPIDLSAKLINDLYGEHICNNSFTRSQLEELLSYLEEGDKHFTTEQKECVQFPRDRDLLIRGTAGSGKSIILMQRAIDLRIKDMQRGIDSTIAILTYTNSLVTNLEMLVSSATHDSAIRVCTLDKMVGEVYKNLHKSIPVLLYGKNEKRALEFVKKAVSILEKQCTKHIAGMSLKFLYEEFQWIKGMGIKTLEEYKSSGRSGRGSNIRMSGDDYEALFNLYKQYNILIKSKGYADRLDLFEHVNRLPDAGLTKYSYVMVDEAQDLPPVILKFAKKLAQNSITIAYDSAQKIYSSAFSLAELGIDIRGRASKSLKRTFRNTLEISKFANALFQHIKDAKTGDGDFVLPEYIGRSGEMPTVIECKNEFDQKNILCALIDRLIKEETGTIGLLYRGENENIRLHSWLKNAGIPAKLISRKKLDSPIQENVRLCSLHSAKGLEFDVVIIPFFQKGIFPYQQALDDSPDDEQAVIDKERKLLFVGITRARSNVFLLFSGEKSMYFDELDSNTYRLLAN
jgi:superfamily I DNA/RNA helicase